MDLATAQASNQLHTSKFRQQSGEKLSEEILMQDSKAHDGYVIRFEYWRLAPVSRSWLLEHQDENVFLKLLQAKPSK